MPTKQNTRGAIGLRRTVALDLTADGKPPTEFRIFTAGSIDTVKGTFLFDDLAAQSVMAAAKDYGNDLPVDYAHAMVMAQEADDPSSAGKAAGWFKPEVRGGELWAASVTWTPAAAQMLLDREYRYISPFFFHDDAARVTELVNVALTNIPATKNLTPLMASRAIDRRSTALSGALSFDEVRCAIEAALRDAYAEQDADGCYSFYPYPSDIYDDRVVFAKDGKLFQVTYRMEGTTAVLTGEPVEVLRTYAPIPTGSTTMDKKQICAALGLPETATDQEIAAKLQDVVTKSKAAPVTAEEPAADLPPAAMARLTEQNAELERQKAKNAELERQFAELRRGNLLTALERTIATDYKALSVNPREFAPVLLSLQEKAPDETKKIEAILKRASAALAASPLLQERGSNIDPQGNGSAGDRLRAKAQELQKADPKLTSAAAMTRAAELMPDVYEQYTQERSAS